MSIKIMTMVWDAAPLAGSELLCLLAMADWANDDGGSVHPSIRAIGEKIRVSEKQARRIVQGLVDAGYLTVVGNPYGGAPGTTKQWVINVGKLRELAAQKQAEEAKTAPMDGTPPMDGAPPTGVPDPSHGCPSTPPTGVPDASHGWEPNRHRTVNRAVREPLLTRAGARAKPQAANRGSKPAAAGHAAKPDGVSEQVWADFLAHRKAKRAPVTQSAVDLIAKEAKKAGVSLEEALQTCCAMGWQGFKATWLLKDQQPRFGGAPLLKQKAIEEHNRAVAAAWLRKHGQSMDGEA